MDVLVGWQLGDNRVEKALEINALLLPGGLRVNLPAGDLQSRKQVQRGIALVRAFHRPNGRSAVGFHVTRRPLERLNARLEPEIPQMERVREPAIRAQSVGAQEDGSLGDWSCPSRFPVRSRLPRTCGIA